VPRVQRDGSLRPYSGLSRPEPLLYLSSSSSVALTRLSGPRLYVLLVIFMEWLFREFGRPSCLICTNMFTSTKMVVTAFSETVVTISKTTPCHNPEEMDVIFASVKASNPRYLGRQLVKLLVGLLSSKG
jgi:hypothetical protein